MARHVPSGSAGVLLNGQVAEWLGGSPLSEDVSLLTGTPRRTTWVAVNGCRPSVFNAPRW